MANNRSASLEARLKNNKDLVTSLKEYSLYSPTSEDIKAGIFESFVNLVDDAITPFKTSTGALTTANKQARDVFAKLDRISKDVRAEICEVKGKDSDEWNQVDKIVKVITGENISDHSKMKQITLKEKKEGEPQPEFNSVSRQDYKSKLGNFRSLTGLLRNYEFYAPSDQSITMSALEAFEAESAGILSSVSSAETKYVTERSRIIHYFNDKGGLKDRAQRAKVHVKRKYGFSSPEYKALTNKRY